jgi:DNA-binding HxlR family transcriptional regulator
VEKTFEEYDFCVFLTRKHHLHILNILLSGNREYRFSEIKNEIGINQSNLSKALAGFIDCRLITKRVHNRIFYYSANENTKRVVGYFDRIETLGKFLKGDSDVEGMLFVKRLNGKVV